MSSIPFEEFSRVVTESGVEPALDFLEQHFRREQDFFKLFEVLKMRCRYQLGLPLIYSKQPDDLDETQQRQLEDSLLEACREIGILFFKLGKFQEGWMYLQPVGDKELNEKLIRKIEADEESIDALIDMAVSQGAAPVYGYRLLLKNYGTCNGITTFDTQANRFDAETQKKMAEELFPSHGGLTRARQLKKFRSALELKANPQDGRAVFNRACAHCHLSVKGLPMNGPDLRSITERSKEGLFTSILNPNESVDPSYFGYSVTLKDGKMLFGRVLAEKENNLTLRLLDGSDRQILRKRIKGLDTSGRSLMPDGLELGMTHQNLADLIGFLQIFGREGE